eukprot:5026283-Prorocentrum_lima.AAC.1
MDAIRGLACRSPSRIGLGGSAFPNARPPQARRVSSWSTTRRWAACALKEKSQPDPASHLTI